MTFTRREFGIAGLDFADRQQIVVVPDEVLEVFDESAATEDERTSSSRVRLLALRGRKPRDIPQSHGESTLLSVFRLRGSGVNILPVGRSEARELRLPAGHPLDGMVYVGDPVYPDRYYQFSDYHVRVFEQKVSDAIKLLGQLGASTLSIRSEYGWGRKTAAKLNLPVSAVPMKGNFLRRQSGSRHVFFRAEIPPRAMREPEGCAWLAHEPMWQQMVELRRQGMSEIELTVAVDSDDQITADLGRRLGKVQLGIGGEFEKFERTKWVIQGKFATRGRSGKS